MNKLIELIENAKNIAITGHVSPDGDCTGSTLGLYNYIIENYKVVKKIQLAIPNEIVGLMKCGNNKCISNHENVETKFIKQLNEENHEIKYKCFYCERTISEEELELKL